MTNDDEEEGGGGGGMIPPKNDDVIYEQPLMMMMMKKVPQITIMKCQISAVGCNLYYTACSGHHVKLPCWTLEAELLTKKFFLYLPLVMTRNRWIPLLENCH